MIGILGLGNYSTVYYIQRLNELYNIKHGGYSTCPFKLLNADFNTINPHLPNDFNILLPIVEQKILELNQLEVSKIIVPNITMHETIDQIDFSEHVTSKIVHPIQLARKSLDCLTITKVVIFGTRYSMESRYIYSFFEDAFEQVIPSESDKQLIDELRQKVYLEDGNDGLRKALQELVEKYTNSESIVVIGCTELSVIAPTTIPVLDLVELQINKALFT